MTIIEIIEALRATTSTNEKIAILEENKKNMLLKDILMYTYDKLTYKYYIKAPKYPKTGENFCPNFMELLDMLKIFNRLNERVVTGNAAKTEVVELLMGLDDFTSDLFECILNRDLRCNISATTINKVWKGAIFSLKKMKPESYDLDLLKNLKFPASCELKEDGAMTVFYVKDSVCKFHSSSGAVIHGLDKQKKDAIEHLNHSGGRMYTGEMIALDDEGNRLPREKSNGIVNKVLKGTASQAEQDSILVVVWDSVDYDLWMEGHDDTPYKERYTRIEEPLKASRCYEAVERIIVNNIKEFRDDFLLRLKQGWEGVIVKELGAPWQNKRVKHQIKGKLEKDSDLRIVSFNEGKGKYKGTLGSINVESDDGTVFCAVSGFKDDDRDEIWNNQDEYRICIMKVTHAGVIENAKTDHYSLFLPRSSFNKIRPLEDKSETDDFTKISSITYGNALFSEEEFE